MTKARNRKLRSEKLTTKEHKAYKSFVRTFPTKLDASLAFGFSVVTLDAVLLKGSGKPETIEKIRERLKPTEAKEEETEPEKAIA